ncbi:MAG TPA: PEGA domain-containing protein [bacterium (Candidatus Stahlbacteria)]|nr:PEGA domain-containing protein [Candidatus Stahlbacteria bacterium]
MERELSSFELIKELGRGATSTCYKARHKPSGKVMLVKILHPQFAEDHEILKRFEREAKIMSRLSHKNILKIIDFGKLNDSYFIAMEFVEGETLRDILKRRKLSINESKYVITQLCDALSYVHSKGIIHRDIKPSNILIEERTGTPKLMDFGLAHVKNLPALTMEGTLIGTPSYMSFEQVQGKNLDPRTDIFSLGLVWLELITGKKGYDGKNYGEIIKNILTKEPKGLHNLDTQVPEGIAKIMRRMLEKDKEKRYRSTTEILEDIRALESKKYRARKQRPSWVTALLFIPIIVILALFFQRFSSKKERPLFTGNDSLQYVEIISPIINDTSTKQITNTTQVKPKLLKLSLNIVPYAKVYVDDKYVGESPPWLEVKFPAGKHKLLLENPNFPKIVKTIDIDRDEQLNINLFDELSYLHVIVEPWAEVYVDGELRGTTPIGKPIILTPQKLKIRLHNPYFKDFEKEYNFEKGDTIRVSVKLTK